MKRYCMLTLALGGMLSLGCQDTAQPKLVLRQCEYPDQSDVGMKIWRSQASNLLVHGQFGTVDHPPYPAREGSVWYTLEVRETSELFLRLRYSKHSESVVPIQCYVDAQLRAEVMPDPTGDWNKFAWTGKIKLGPVPSGTHKLKLSTVGQLYGVADLDLIAIGSEAQVDSMAAIQGVPRTW